MGTSDRLVIELADGSIIERANGSWGRVSMASGNRVLSFEVAHGALLLKQGSGVREAFAPGSWTRVRYEDFSEGRSFEP